MTTHHSQMTNAKICPTISNDYKSLGYKLHKLGKTFAYKSKNHHRIITAHLYCC